MFKKCSACAELKTLDCFANAKAASDGKQWKCKDCQKLYRQINRQHISKQQKDYRNNNQTDISLKRKLYIIKNKETITAKNIEYYTINKIQISEKQKLYRLSNPEKIKEIENKSKQKHRINRLEKQKIYRLNNKEKIREYRQRPEVIARRKANRLKNKDKINANKKYQEKLKRNTDPSYKLIINQRTRINQVLKRYKTKKTLDLLGCSPQFLREHIEKQFTEGMNWDNYGKYGWHIDHIKPCASFDLTDIEQQKICFHYTNLQPLWAEENLRKSNKIYA